MLPGSSDSSDLQTSRRIRHEPLAPTASRLVTYEKISARISRGRWSMDVVAGVDAPGTKSVDSF